MKNTVFALGALFAFATGPAVAAVVDGSVSSRSGSFMELDGSAPLDLTSGFSDGNIYALNETQNFTLTEDLELSVGGTLSAGTVVSSHYVFFNSERWANRKGYLEFDSNVLGIATSNGELAATDALISNSITYEFSKYRGTEGADDVSISATDTNRVSIDWTTRSGWGDYVRVFTRGNVSTELAAIPLPASGMLLLCGLAGLAGTRRAKRS